MKDIRELLEQSKGVERVPVDEVAEVVRWNKAKERLDKLPALYESIIKEKIEANPKRVKMATKTAGTLYEYTSRVGAYEAALVWKKFNKRDHAAYYIMWNPILGVCYIRDLKAIIN